jgi:hypothetical protein
MLLRRRVFSHFVRERLVRDLIVCKIQGEREPLRENINRMFSTADFLGYQCTDQDLVDRVVMNLHTSVLAHTAFMDRSHSRQDLESIVGLIEEKVSRVKNTEASYTKGAHFSRKPAPPRESSIAPP